LFQPVSRAKHVELRCNAESKRLARSRFRMIHDMDVRIDQARK